MYTWKDGTIYEGEFANDLKHGEGAINYGNGKIIKYQWINGTAVTKKAEMRIANRSETSNKTQPIGTISHEKRRGISAFKEKYPKSRSGNGSQLPDRQSRESKILLKFNNI